MRAIRVWIKYKVSNTATTEAVQSKNAQVNTICCIINLSIFGFQRGHSGVQGP